MLAVQPPLDPCDRQTPQPARAEAQHDALADGQPQRALLDVLGQSPVGRLLRAHDWRGCEAGSPSSWSLPVVTLVRLMMSSNSPMCLQWGPQLQMIYNDAYAVILDEKHPAALGQPLAEVWREIWPELEPMVTQVLAGQAVQHRDMPFAVKRRKGLPEDVWFSCAWSPAHDEHGRTRGFFAVLTETTSRKNLDVEQRENETKFRDIINAMPQIVWSTLPDGLADYYNQQWYDFTGVPAGSTDGAGWNGVFHVDDQSRAMAAWQHSLTSGEPFETEYRLRHHTGEYRWVLGRGLPLRNERHEIVRWMGTCTDIHERKMSQEALQLSDRRKDEFLAVLSHELRNPLAPIATAADMLVSGQLKDAEVQRLSRVIARQAVHMTSLIEDLLDVSRVTRGLVALVAEPVNMTDVVAEAVEQVRPVLAGRAHHLQTQLVRAGAMVLGEKKRLVQVVANLLSNAARYTPHGGKICLSVTVIDDEVELAVRDNGIGMSAALVLRAFDLFVQGERTADCSQGGLGIGLALVRSLVQLHGGKVTAHSEGAGLGSAFNVVLPRLKQATQASQTLSVAIGNAVSTERAPLRVLVVDDNGDAADILGMFLEMLGYEVSVAYSSAQALALAAHTRCHVCLLDIGLPGINGYELALQMRQLPGLEGVMLAAVTGYGQARDKAAASEAGFDMHFVKPLDDAKLQAFLKAIDAARETNADAKGKLAGGDLLGDSA